VATASLISDSIASNVKPSNGSNKNS
jgi:hypothetical protein